MKIKRKYLFLKALYFYIDEISSTRGIFPLIHTFQVRFQ